MPGVLNDLGFGFGSFPKELPQWASARPARVAGGSSRLFQRWLPRVFLPQTAPRWPKMASKTPPRRPRWPPRRLRWPQDASKTAQGAPKTAQGGLKMAQDGPRGPQEASKTAQEASKTRLWVPKTSQQASKMVAFPYLISKSSTPIEILRFLQF